MITMPGLVAELYVALLSSEQLTDEDGRSTKTTVPVNDDGQEV
jgi:hypothetical protein